MRFKATLYHMEQSGLNAVPIIALTSLLIGIVIAYQGAVQLEKFGANIFIVEMVGISATRELAPLIAAIVVAGRSASSFTAQIGVMKITEEVDAMKTMGFGPWEFLVLPRVIALMVVMPLIVIFADAISVLGGMIVAKSQLGISFGEFMDRFQEVIALKHILIGLIKAPIFGWIIALIGCFRGFQINSSTESVGKYTTISVVNAIFWVIAFNALFSVFLTELGI
jgi:phospholipid/cholesterol/gamma-HCH transport system permease protein